MEDSLRLRQRIRLSGHRAPGLYAGRHRRRHCGERWSSCEMLCCGRPAFLPRAIEQILIERSCRGLEGNRIRGHPRRQRATASPSATWKTSIRSAYTRATPSSSRRRQTLRDPEHQMLRSASMNIISALGIEGGCNVQYALNPDSMQYYRHRGQPARVAAPRRWPPRRRATRLPRSRPASRWAIRWMKSSTA